MSGQATWMVFTTAASYFIGAVPFGYIIARAKGVDLQKVGSGNIGATNVARALGRKWGLMVFLLDGAKGAGPVLVARFLIAPQIGVSQYLLGALCAAAVVLGHIFPVYLRLRGGKGVATGAGATAALLPLPLLAAAAIWLIALLTSRIVSVASISAAVAFPTAHLLLATNPFSNTMLPATLYAFLIAALVIIRHKSNIKRLIAGKEPRIGKKRTKTNSAC